MMQWSLPLAMLGLLAGCACKAPANHADANVDVNGIERVQIEYRHMGWDNIEEHYTLVPRGEAFVLRSSYEGRNHVQRGDLRTVPAARVRDLVAAVKASAWTRRQSMHQLAMRISARQLLPGSEGDWYTSTDCGKAEQRVLAGQYMKHSGPVEILDAFYAETLRWTDDDPQALVRIFHRNGTRTVFHSDSQKALMLPWVIGEREEPPSATTENWSIPMTTTLRALVPPDSRLHERLDGVNSTARDIRSHMAWEARERCTALRQGLPASYRFQ
ncbi:hypothetical protein CQ393_06745 [Stenotrophomonas sp. MYb238]|uniref:hypothetical protein n=1 Tax=Stenotrophomonas sp. MYb238 TaxID=2040281 RepID=UPI001291573A|nr:hypothetical protein [Stenotrophomonas sp. MYb238]MQP75589.1 hypothetical protein [Stenotrophomonas sp. MYb238]